MLINLPQHPPGILVREVEEVELEGEGLSFNLVLASQVQKPYCTLEYHTVVQVSTILFTVVQVSTIL